MRTIMSEKFPKWRAHSNEILVMLGVRGKLPVEGMNARVIQGITVWVRPLPPRAPGETWKRSNHRVRCECPECGKEMSLGRLFQHKCKPFTADDVGDYEGYLNETAVVENERRSGVPHFDTNRDRED